MNGVAPSLGQPPTIWQEHRTPDGRSYYYNSLTKATQWTKPEDLMSPAERALANQPWKEYTAEGGRKYWYNTETKQSSWEMPDAYRTAIGATSGSSSQAPSIPQVAAGGSSSAGYDQYREPRDSFREPRQITYGSDPQAQAFFVPASSEPDYSTFEEAEAAFMKMLRRCGVQSDWTWEQTIRATVKDPQHRAIKDPKDRKAAFEKYCHEMITQDKERVKERLTKLRADFETMLKRHPEIKHYTRWKTARAIIEGETIFRSTKSENERRQLFEEYIIGLKKAHVEHQAAMRKSAMDAVIDLLPKLNLEPYTRWSDAQGIISSTLPFQNDEKYKALSRFDVLTAFQNHMKALERTFNDSKQEQKNRKFRQERQRRDGFLALLAELRRDGRINAGTKWQQILPLVEGDDRYKALVGQSGSTAQDLFWDLVEAEERGLRGTRNEVLDVIEDKRFEVTPKTSFQEFLSVVKDDRRTANIERDILMLIFERLQQKKVKRSEDDKHSERQQKKAADNLKSYMRHLDPPISVQDKYESVRARLLKSEEFQAVASEETRRAVFDKVLKRLREREEDAERERAKRRDRGSSERGSYRERDRSRGERSHRNGGRPARRSRTPEPDAYEADRRKAIAERERNHRKSTMAESLLSVDRRLSPPPRRERDHDRERDRDRDRDRVRERERDRDRDHDRHTRSRRDEDSPYERERRDREEERERRYGRRVDRGGSYDELPYGDDRASTRRRRTEDEDDRKDSKRLRRDRSPREHTPQRDARHNRNRTPPPPVKEDPGVHSGSEEGEIEED